MNTWLMRPVPRPFAELRLFCVPFAGVGPSAFRGWAQSLPAAIETFYVQLPGRESRLREAPIRSVAAVGELLADQVAPLLDRPFAFFGHSLGGLIAYETARVLRQRGLATPTRLFASACRAPHEPSPFAPLHHLTEDEFLGQVNQRYNGSIPAEVVANAELREIFVPPLRADFMALETYIHRHQAPLDCPITVFAGTDDRTIARPALEGWSRHSSKGYRLHLVKGGHFYLQSAREQLVSGILADVADALTPVSGVGGN